MSLKHTHKSFILSLLVIGLMASACSKRPAGDQPRAEYDPKTRQLARIVFDLNKNGKNDTVSYMEGTHIRRVELDLDENGRVDRWDFYKPDGSLEKVGLASRTDGVIDSQAFYGPSGQLQRIEVSTKHDGRFDRTEFYQNNELIRSQDDTNGDSRPDKWDEYVPYPNHRPGEPAYRITATAFDDAGSGHPQRRFVWAADGTVARVESDPAGSGHWQPRTTALARVTDQRVTDQR